MLRGSGGKPGGLDQDWNHSSTNFKERIPEDFEKAFKATEHTTNAVRQVVSLAKQLDTARHIYQKTFVRRIEILSATTATRSSADFLPSCVRD